MRRSLLLSVLFALAVPCIGQAARQAPSGLVPNGDFSQGLAGWWNNDAAICQASVVDADVAGFRKALRLAVTPKPGAKPWDVILVGGLNVPLKQGDRIQLSAWMRSPEGCKISGIVQLAKDPWTNLLSQTVTLTPEWKEYLFQGVAAQEYAAGGTGLCFQMGHGAGTIEMTGIRVAALGDNPLSLIPFVLPWDDASPSVANVSGWLEKPAGGRGFVAARGGHLSAGDRRIRFFGANITTSACFPRHEDAEKVAARLAKFGVNCIRFHHMDASWASDVIFAPDRRTLDPAQMDRLDYFIAQLKQRGIYADLNLHVSRVYPGQPTWEGMPEFLKGVDNFYPPMVEMQREYARALLTHLNPYTKTRYVDEPAVAFVEINNENGLNSQWWWGSLDHMPALYSDELKRQWNVWLKAHYRTDAELKQAWDAVARPFGPEVLANGAFARGPEGWTLETNGGAKGTAEPLAAGPGGKPALRLTIAQIDGEGWHAQFLQPGLKLRKGEIYTLSFQARADKPRSIGVDARQAHEPWRTFWSTNIGLTPEWQTFRLVVSPSEDDDNARVTFTNLGTQVGTVDLASVSLRSGGGFQLREGDALGSAGIVTRAEYTNLPSGMRRDWMRFLWETEESYWTGMARFLKEELKVRSLVFGSAVGFSPVPIQAQLDLVDAHSYWQHPVFPGQAWDSTNWIVNNVAMAGQADGGTLAGLALNRVAGKPFLVTEYNHPAPNTHSSEAFLLLAAYAGLQDWDGIFAFAYQGSRDNWDARRIDGFFDIDQHPTQMASIPAAVALFLRADVRAPEKPLVAAVTREQCLETLGRDGPWFNAGSFGIPGSALFRRPVALRLGARVQAPQPPAAAGGQPLTSDNGDLTWDSRGGKGVVTINAPRSRGVIGSTEKGPFTLGDVQIAPKPNLQNWAAITLTMMEGDSFARPGRILLTATGYAENTAMGWRNAEKNTVGTGWGKAPSLVEGIPAAITLPVAAARVQAWALDERGQRGDAVSVRDAAGKAVLEIGPQYRTVWYELVVR